MTRAEIETYLLHAKVEPASFVLDEQADLLANAIKREVIEARIEELDLSGCRSPHWTDARMKILSAKLAALEGGKP